MVAKKNGSAKEKLWLKITNTKISAILPFSFCQYLERNLRYGDIHLENAYSADLSLIGTLT